MGKWSVDNKFGDILKDPKSREVFERFVPGASKNPKARMAFGFTVRALAEYPQMGLPKDKLEELDAALKAIE